MKNQILDPASNGYGTELDDILHAIGRKRAFNPKKLEEHFWGTFVIDAFIGNPDRHNRNWGFYPI